MLAHRRTTPDGELAGMVHDLGKGTERYHGAQDGMERLAAEILAYAVAAHHGLMDCADDTHRSELRLRLERQDIGFEEAEARFLTECAGMEELNMRFWATCVGVQMAVDMLDDLFEDTVSSISASDCWWGLRRTRP